ncbi:hypothetical protein E2L07_19755 [Halalkalibacterium halodurans]|uniref:polysaccharide pyruvyl transferase family protein n=1 Tax=Halalkalibacterium halodurans TaxID=86665 RepID=UPI0010678534|nr:polysaccharide pyruvyl transferase family protein [Halalkalibacterium halodurans]TES46075.1 hypothetical protein E2L07_19755 [Halalkalibacterium halodurans]
MKVLIHGFYGAGNAGDDAILHVIINQLQSINKNVEVTVVIRSKQLKPYYGTANVNYILGLNFEEITKVLKESSLLIVGGGGLFQDYNESHPENLFHNQEGALNYYLAPIILAKMLNVKTMLYGVGIGPLSQEDSLKTMKWIADIVDAITVRDQDSFQILNSLGITKHVLSADPALQLRADCSNKDDIIPKDKRLV